MLDKKIIKAAVNAILYLREAQIQPTQSMQPSVQTIGSGLDLFKTPLTGDQASVALITKFSPENLIQDIREVFEQNGFSNQNPQNLNNLTNKALTVLQGKYSTIINSLNPQIIQEAHGN